MTTPLLKCREEEGAVFDNRAAERRAVLRARKGRFLFPIIVNDGSKGVARLNCLVADKAEDVAVKFVRPAFGHDVDDAARRAAKLGDVRIGVDLKFLHGFRSEE